MSPPSSSSLPGNQGRRAASRAPKSAFFLLDLAPDGGCLAAIITNSAGGLLHHLFTLTHIPFQGLSGMSLWPCPEIHISPSVTWHPALWCTDFPHRAVARRAHSTNLGKFIITKYPAGVKYFWLMIIAENQLKPESIQIYQIWAIACFVTCCT